MSGESQFHSEGRKLSPVERELIFRIVTSSGPEHSRYLPELSELRVEEMDDGHMGSLYILNPKKNKADRKFGRELGVLMVKDSDSVDVSVSLNLDTEGGLYELDIWKTDFTPVVKLIVQPSRL